MSWSTLCDKDLVLCLSHNLCSLNADCCWMIFSCPKWIWRKRSRGRLYPFIYLSIRESIDSLHLNELSVRPPTLRFPTATSIAIWTFSPRLLLAKLWVIYWTTGLCPRWLPQQPFLPDLLLCKVMPSSLEIGFIISFL